MKEISLNFISIHPRNPQINVFSKPVSPLNEERPFDDVYQIKSIVSHESSVWLSLQQKDGFEPYSFTVLDNPNAAKWVCSQYLTPLLQQYLESFGYEVSIGEKIFPRIDVKIKQLQLGWQGIRCEWIWLSSKKQLGLQVDFHFYKNENIQFSKEVQKLSLSLNNQGAPNRDFYQDKFNWIKAFLTKLEAFGSGEEIFRDKIGFEYDFASLGSEKVMERSYEFFGMNSCGNPYVGIRKFGPFLQVKNAPTFFFVFLEKDIAAARFLYTSLIGKAFPAKFSGMYPFFKVPFGSANVKHVIIPDFSRNSLEAAALQIKNSGCEYPVCLVIIPGDEESYYTQKAIFLQHNLPSQDVRYDRLQNEGSFQWSISGIALQLFCKAGGQPWCVQTKRKDTLVVGISQLWENPEKGDHRYIAYSVTSDASGIFQDINTLSDKTNEDDYITGLTCKLAEQLKKWAGKQNFRRIVLHCSFKLSKKAMHAVRDVVKNICNSASELPQTVIMRINTEHSYSGYDKSRASMVPDECSYIKLGFGKYLIWCDGVRNNQTAGGRPSAPVFVNFGDSIPKISTTEELELLEDLSNLSGANWRGFSAKTRPVSVFYCNLVGQFIKNFNEYNLPIPAIEQFTPWFL